MDLFLLNPQTEQGPTGPIGEMGKPGLPVSDISIYCTLITNKLWSYALAGIYQCKDIHVSVGDVGLITERLLVRIPEPGRKTCRCFTVPIRCM